MSQEPSEFYKVFSLGSSGVLRSLYYSTLPHDIRLEYLRGRWNYPTVGRMFVCSDLIIARNQANSFVDAVVWRVEVEDPVRCHWTAPTWNMDAAGCEKFWQRRGVWEHPSRTVFDGSRFFKTTWQTYAVTGIRCVNPVHISHELGFKHQHDTISCCGELVRLCYMAGNYYYRCRDCGERFAYQRRLPEG